MNEFLSGFNLKQKNSNKNNEFCVEVTDELNALLKIYNSAEKDLLKKENSSLEILNTCMERYIEVKKERNIITENINALKKKLRDSHSLQDQHENDDESCDECEGES